MDSIKVGIRVRPLLPRETGGRKWVVQGPTAIVPTTPGTAGFEFDHVFDESATTEQIYTTLTRPIVHSVMEGFNGTVFAYGQTSSGKTFTMMGMEEHPGVIPLAIDEIFAYIEEHEELEFIVRISYLEIYKEGIIDLLDQTSTDLKIREDRENNVRVHGLKEFGVTNLDEVTRAICFGNINRTTGATNMNERSSRSHAVLSIAVESRIKNGDGTVKVSSLNLVDLAGSERLSATGAAGKRAQEGIAINKSLFTIKQVISKLSEGNSSGHIPYRDSKLTHILKPSLGGNAKTAIICAVTPAECYETELTLSFALCARKVKNRPMVNEVFGGEEALQKKLKQFERENEELRRKLGSSESGLTEERRKELTEQMQEKESRQAELEARIHTLEEIIISSKAQHNDQPGKTTTASKASHDRRRTICPASLARGMGSPLLFRQGPTPRHSYSPAVTPEIVSRSVARIKRQVQFSSPIDNSEHFQSFFNSSGFERELIAEQSVRRVEHDDETVTADPAVHVRDLERRRTMFRCPTFVLDTPASTSWQDVDPDSVMVPQSTLIDAQVQTEAGLFSVRQAVHEAAIQASTEKADIDTQTEFEVHSHEEVCVAGESTPAAVGPGCRDGVVSGREAVKTDREDLDSSFCPCHYKSADCHTKKELEESEQFLNDEIAMVREEMVEVQHELAGSKAELDSARVELTDLTGTLSQTQQELASERERSGDLEKKLERSGDLEKKLETVKTKLSDQEMACTAQEEYLMELCQKSKSATHRQEELERQLESRMTECERWEVKGKEMVGEISDLKEQLQALRAELEKLPATKDHCSEDSQQLALLAEKLEKSELTRQRESEHFQQCFQQKVQEVQKAQTMVYYLQEQLEEAQQATPPVLDTYDCTCGSAAELKRVEEELQLRERVVEEKQSVVEGLKKDVADLQNRLSTLSEEASISSHNHQSEDLVAAKADLQSAEEAKSRLESQLASVSSELHDVREDLQEKQSVVDSLKRDVSDLQNRLSTLSEEASISSHNHQSEDLVAAKADLQSAEEAKSRLESQLASVSSELHDMKSSATERADSMVSELEAQLQLAAQRLHEAQTALQEKDAESRALTEEVEILRKNEITLNLNIAECADDIQAWQEERTSLEQQLQEAQTALQMKSSATERADGMVSELEAQLQLAAQRLHEAQTALQEKDAESRALTEEVEILRKNEITLNLNIAKSADDIQAWQEERTSLEQQLQEAQTALQMKSSATERADGMVSELEAQLQLAAQRLHEAQTALQEKDAESRALTEEVEILRKNEITLNLNIAECADDFQAWQEKRTSLEQQLQDAQTALQEKDAESRALTEEVEILRKNEITLNLNIAECADDFQAWQEERTSLEQQLQDAQTALQEKDAESRALTEEVEILRKNEITLNLNIADCADDFQAWQEKRTSLEQQLQDAQTALQEKDAESRALTEEVEILRKNEITLNLNIATSADDFFEEITEKEIAWQDERASLQQQVQEAQTALQEKDAEEWQDKRTALQNQYEEQTAVVGRLQAQVTSLQRQVAQAQQQPSDPVALAEADRKVNQVLKQNDHLKSQLQAQLTTYQPSATSAGALGCDSSGVVTSAVCYQLRGEVQQVREEKGKLEARVTKLKTESQKKLELYNKEKVQCTRYREERNIFRAKYFDLKKRHAELQSASTDVVPVELSSHPPPSSHPPSSQPPSSHRTPSSQPPSSHRAPSSQPPHSSSSHPLSSLSSHAPRSSSSASHPATRPPTLSKPPVASLSTPLNNPRRSIFSYVPTNPPVQQQPHKPRQKQEPPVKSMASQMSSTTSAQQSKLSTGRLGENAPTRHEGGQTTAAHAEISSAPQAQNDIDELWETSLIQTRPQMASDKDQCQMQ